jgi:hypothetical protein
LIVLIVDFNRAEELLPQNDLARLPALVVELIVLKKVDLIIPQASKILTPSCCAPIGRSSKTANDRYQMMRVTGTGRELPVAE